MACGGLRRVGGGWQRALAAYTTVTKSHVTQLPRLLHVISQRARRTRRGIVRSRLLVQATVHTATSHTVLHRGPSRLPHDPSTYLPPVSACLQAWAKVPLWKRLDYLHKVRKGDGTHKKWFVLQPALELELEVEPKCSWHSGLGGAR